MINEVKKFLLLLEEKIPPGERQHHNITVEEGKLYVWLMLGKEYVPVTFIPFVDDALSIEELVNDIAGIPAVRKAMNDNQ